MDVLCTCNLAASDIRMMCALCMQNNLFLIRMDILDVLLSRFLELRYEGILRDA